MTDKTSEVLVTAWINVSVEQDKALLYSASGGAAFICSSADRVVNWVGLLLFLVALLMFGIGGLLGLIKFHFNKRKIEVCIAGTRSKYDTLISALDVVQMSSVFIGAVMTALFVLLSI